jgi:hypothetical protein
MKYTNTRGGITMLSVAAHAALGEKSPALKPATTPISVQLSEHKFTALILPHSSMPKRSPKCTRGYRCVFTLIL